MIRHFKRLLFALALTSTVTLGTATPSPAVQASTPTPTFVSPANGAHISTNANIFVAVKRIHYAGYRWALALQSGKVVWQTKPHTTQGPNWTIGVGSKPWKALPKPGWVEIRVRAVVRGHWSAEAKNLIYIYRPVAGFDPGHYGGKANILSNFDDTLAEPNDQPHRNYCGPGASQVLISHWAPNNVPDIQTLADEEKLDPNYGVYASNMIDPINKAIGQNYYSLFHAAQADTQADFSDLLGRNTYDNGHPVIVALKTRPNGDQGPELNGWDLKKINADHIVMVYGFDFTNGMIYYYETAGTVAGTSSTGINRIPYKDFWVLVQANNVQIAN